MSLDQKTLDLLTAKDQTIEAQWLGNERIIFLKAKDRHWQIMEHQASAQEDLALSEILIGSSLPYAGQFIAQSQKGEIAVLGADAAIHLLDRDSFHEQSSLTLQTPATDLTFDFRTRLSWVSSDPSGKNIVYRQHAEKRTELFASEDFIRHLQWNPSADEALYLSWPQDALPWQSAALFLWNSKLKTSERIAPHGLEESPVSEACFSPNGKYLAASILTGDFFQIWLLRLETKTWVQISFDSREHSTPLRRSSRRNLSFLNDRTILALSSDKAYWQLEAFDHHGHNQVLASPMSHLQNLAVNPSTEEILGLGSGIQYPQQILRFERRNNQWIAKPEGEVLRSKLKAEPISWASENGEIVHGILYRDHSAKAPTPLLIPIHGGPTDAVHASWPSKAIAFVQQGYAVLYINYRGSWGFGFDYHSALGGHWGKSEIADCVSAVKSLAGSDWIDPKRVGLWGGGTASFTVLWALIKHPEVFHAGVAVFPILDLAHHFSLCSPQEKSELIWALGSSDPKFLAEHSPLNSLHQLERPLALFAGGKDKLTDPAMLDRAAEILKEKKLAAWISIYEDEGRAWRSHATYIDYYSKVAGFFDRFLRFRNSQD